jgi:WD40 repeat protein
MIPRRRPGAPVAADQRQDDAGRHHAFITYARRPADLKFVDELCDELAQRGKRVWVDRADIPPGADWLARIAKGIEAASSLIFVVSPSSVASDVCNQELAIALEQNKRVIPVLHQAVDPDALPPALAKLNWIPFTVAGERPQSFEKLVEAIDTDLEWRDDHTRLTVRANEWASEGRDRSFLLRGRDLRDALRWYADAGTHKESPTPTQLEYVMASRHEAARRQRLGFAAVSAALGVAIVLAIFALVQRSDAIHQTALAQSRLVAVEATDPALGDVRLQDLLGLAAYSLAPTTQARSALVSAIEQPLVRVLPPAVGEVNAVAYSPDGRVIAVGGVHGVALWNAASRTRIGARLDAAQQVNAVAFAPDGSSILVGESDGFVKQFRLSDHSVLRRFATDGSGVTGVAVSPSGQDFAAVTDGGRGAASVFFWVPGSDISRHVIPAASGHLLAVAFSPDNALLAVGGGVFLANGGTNGLAVVYHLTSSTQPTQTFNVPGFGINHVAFSPDSATLAAADGAGKVDLFSPANPSGRQLIAVGSSVQVIAFADAPSGLLATGDASGAIRLWDYRTQQPVSSPLREGLVVYGLAFSPDGRSLAGGGRDGSVFIWSASGRMPLARSIAGGIGIQQLSLNRAATQVATADRDGGANLWNLATGRRIHHFADHNPRVAITSAEFGPRAGMIALGLTTGEVEFVNAASAASAGSVPPSGK